MQTYTGKFLALCLLFAASACGGGGGGGGGGPEAPFRYTASSPSQGDQAVLLDARVIVHFSKRIDPASVTEDSLVVGEIGGAGRLSGTTILVSDTEGRSLQWTPSTFLRSAAPHEVDIDPTLRSVDGDLVGGDLDIQFRTVAGSPPTELPVPSQMRQVGALAIGRQAHAATLLGDGRVLVTGGFRQGNNLTDRAEVFSTGTESFTELSSRMVTARASHTSTRLPDGRVLICGGFIPGGSPGTVTSTSTCEIFNPVSSTFQSTGSMHVDRVDAAAVVLPDGRVLITGGSRLVGSFLEDLDSAEFYDPATGTFSEHPDTLIHTRATHDMIETTGNRFIIGGGSDVDARTGLYDAGIQTFADLGQAALDNGRYGAAMASFESGDVVITGGDDLGSVIHVFASDLRVQNTGSALGRERAYHTADRYGADRILVCGGIDFSRGGFIMASVDVIIESDQTEGSRTFETEVRLPTGMAFHTSTVLSNGQILLCGGLNENGSLENKRTAALFTP